jgi:hypothetical protein
MRTPRALLPLAVAAGLAAVASPASAADNATAHASGGDVPPVVPSLIQTRITRAENALERLTEYVDDQDSAHVVKVSKVIRRQTAAAWRGAKYYLRTAPPPVADDAAFRPNRKRSLKQDDPVGPVVADQFASAVAVFGLVHDVVSQSVELTDGAHGNTLVGVSKTLFWTLDKRDAMVRDAQTFEPPAEEPDAAAARKLKAAISSQGGARKLMQDDAGGSFAALMPEVTAGLADEQQHIQGLQSDATDLNVRGRQILRQGLTQILLTQLTINTIWPPVVDD